MEASTTRPSPTVGPSPTPTTVALPSLPSGPTQAQPQAQQQLPFTASSLPPRTPQPPPQPPILPQPMAVSGGNRSSSYLERRDEGLLRDVLEELDRERSKRAELEAQVRTLDDQVQAFRRLQREEQQQQKGAKSPSSGLLLPTRQDYAALDAERRGYLELLEALTNNQPSFRTAAEAELLASSSSSSTTTSLRKTLPLHVVRLLEIMPWDEQTQPHLFGQEQVYEWQIWSAHKTWQPELKFFPTVFKTLPIVLPQPGHIVQEGLSTTPRGGGARPSGGFATVGALTSRSNVVAALLKGAAGSSTMAPPKHCVLTNLTVTQILNIDHGYPLPHDGGTWQWIGGWRIERNMDTDPQGWSYSNSVTLYSTSSRGTSGASPTTASTDFTSELVLPEPGTPNIIKRRRKWTRTRVLVDYPHASTSSREYLKLVAQRASLMVSVEKLSEQLVETKMKLTTLEEDHHALREQATRAVSQLGKDHLNDREQLQILLTALQETLEHREQEQLEKDGDFKQVPQSTAPAASVASLTQALTRQLGDRLGTLSSSTSSSVGTSTASNIHNPANAMHSATTTTTSSTTTTTNSNLKTQQVMDWTKGQGSQLLEKLKQSGAKEQTSQILEKLKNAGASDWTKDQGNQLLTKVFKPKKTFVQPSSVTLTTTTTPATTSTTTPTPTTTAAASAASSLVNSLPWSRSHHRHNSNVSSSSSQDHTLGETYRKGTTKDETTIPETVVSSSSSSSLK
jgi:hypothetical protein